MATNKKELTFEAASARLEEVIASLEDGSAELEKSLALYEEGIALVRLCNEKLDTAEQTIRMLQKQADGRVTETEFEAEI